MVTGGDFRHDAAVERMQIDLAVQCLAEEPRFGVEKGNPGLVTARFQPQYAHRRRIIPQYPGFAARQRVFGFAKNRMRRYHVQFSHGPVPGLFIDGSDNKTGMPSVRIKENEYFDAALRRFKRACEKAGVLTELRRREFYEKPTQERKRKKAAAVKRHLKRTSRDAARRTRLY